LGFAGVGAVVVPVPVLLVVVSVPVAVVAVVPEVVLTEGVGTATLPTSSPAFVTRNVMARTITPNAAMIAGRGRSVRVAVGKV
jgi:hypothetical protein